jgi:chromate transporter
MSSEVGIPRQTLGALFLRFLRFGSLAWGGPVAQIAMIKRELVDEEKWITPERFNRAYAVYQMLPGPEAHELCVYFGTLARGRLGGLLAGLGFMLPGFVLMLLLSWVYVSYGITAPSFAAVFAGVQAAVLALIVRAVHRIGAHALNDRFLWAITIVAAAATLAGVHFAIVLLLAGLGYEMLVRKSWALAGVIAVLAGVFVAVAAGSPSSIVDSTAAGSASTAPPGLAALFGSGLRSGLLTFGGAYTVIPFLLNDSVDVGGWVTREQFLDGVALGGILPAPLIIFATFVGYLAGGLLGALALTAGIFLPAFGFTMVGHEYLERMMHHPALKHFLAGVTAGVVGLIAATTVLLAPDCISGLESGLIFAVGLFLLYRLRAKWTVAAVVALAGLAGYFLFGASK